MQSALHQAILSFAQEKQAGQLVSDLKAENARLTDENASLIESSIAKDKMIEELQAQMQMLEIRLCEAEELAQSERQEKEANTLSFQRIL